MRFRSTWWLLSGSDRAERRELVTPSGLRPSRGAQSHRVESELWRCRSDPRTFTRWMSRCFRKALRAVSVCRVEDCGGLFLQSILWRWLATRLVGWATEMMSKCRIQSVNRVEATAKVCRCVVCGTVQYTRPSKSVRKRLKIRKKKVLQRKMVLFESRSRIVAYGIGSRGFVEPVTAAGACVVYLLLIRY